MIETDVLRKVLMDASARIIAMGGGAWTISENRKMIAGHKALTIWLDVPFELCWRRIEAGGEARPLARTREMAQKLYAERLPIYAQADVRIPVNENESAGEIAAKVVERVRHQAND